MLIAVTTEQTIYETYLVEADSHSEAWAMVNDSETRATLPSYEDGSNDDERVFASKVVKR